MLGVLGRQQTLCSEHIQACCTLECRTVRMTQADNSLLGRPQVTGVGNVEGNALCPAIQVVACGYSPRKPIEQSAADHRKTHALLVDDQFLVSEPLRHRRIPTLQRILKPPLKRYAYSTRLLAPHPRSWTNAHSSIENPPLIPEAPQK